VDVQHQLNHQDSFLNLVLDDGLQGALPRIAELLIEAAALLERESLISGTSSATAMQTAPKAVHF
jgi:hypothetical protein